MKTITKTHFRVDAEGITDLVRQIFHYEDNPEKALDILNCFRGIPLEDAYAIINGDARLSSPNGVTFHVDHEPDDEFIINLTGHKEWKKGADKRRRDFEENIWYEMDTLMRVQHPDLVKPMERTKVLIDASRVSRTHTMFNDMAHGFCEKCGGHEKCTHTLMSSCDLIKEMLSKINIPESYLVTKTRFISGKPWINRHKFDDVSEIEVVNMAGFEVRKSLLDNYVSDIITRLRNAQKQRSIDPEENIWYIEGMERIRRDLHGEILSEAGYDVMDMCEGAQLFRAMIEQYLENKSRLYGVVV